MGQRSRPALEVSTSDLLSFFFFVIALDIDDDCAYSVLFAAFESSVVAIHPLTSTATNSWRSLQLSVGKLRLWRVECPLLERFQWHERLIDCFDRYFVFQYNRSLKI